MILREANPVYPFPTYILFLYSAGLDATLSRLGTSLVPPSATTPSFVIGTENRSYKHQYANIYFVRLRMLRSCVEENAKRRWKTLSGMVSTSSNDEHTSKDCFVI